MILLIDNYDSFSYNLYQLAGSIEPYIKTVKNDELSVKQIKEICPSGIIISPGPGKPCDAGICEQVIQQCTDIPILGVCLGHQAICESFGAEIIHAKELIHGKPSMIKQSGESRLFRGIPQSFSGARYHSLAVDESTLPEVLTVTARADDNEIMAVQHIKYDIYGVQFHPESVMSGYGYEIMKNIIEITNNNRRISL